MSNKLVLWREGWLVTWLDSPRQDQWAIVDPGSGKIVQAGPLGAPCVDKHCGAVLVLARGFVTNQVATEVLIALA